MTEEDLGNCPDRDFAVRSVVSVTVEVGPFRCSASRELSPRMFDRVLKPGGIDSVIVELMNEATAKARRKVDGHPQQCRRRKRR
jgi:hypothetical protein